MTTFHRRYFLSPRRKVICKSLDLLLAPLHRPTAIATPSRILVSNIGHLGDLVIAGSVAPILKQHYPQAIIGYLVSSYSQCVLEENPYIDQTHLLDHWVLNRTPIAKPEKKRLYRINCRRVLKELKEAHYDVAIELYPYFGNTSALLWRAGIPTRIGYSSGGFGALLTHQFHFPSTTTPLIQLHSQLLQILSPHIGEIPYYLPHPSPAALHLPPHFALLHIGSGAPEKDWCLQKWRQLATQLEMPLVFSGRGAREQAMIQQVTRGLDHCINLCDQCTWGQHKALVSQAQYVITTDTVTSHIAEAYCRPTLVLMADHTDSTLWSPPHAIAIKQSEASADAVARLVTNRFQPSPL